MTKDVIDGSRYKNETEQQALVAKFAKDNKIDYEVPTVLNTLVCLLTRFVSSKERLFSNEPWTYTRCQDKVKSYQVSVGGFTESGLHVVLSSWSCRYWSCGPSEVCLGFWDTDLGLVKQSMSITL